jgi:hypothetical protein
MLNFSDDAHYQHLVELRNKHVDRLRELELNQAAFGYSTSPEIIMEIKDIRDRIDDLDKQLSKFNLAEVHTIFSQDLNTLIQQTANNFEGIIGKQGFVAPEQGTVAYKSKFSFEYSISNNVWCRADGTRHFTCSFYDGASLSEADVIYTEYAKQIKLSLAKDWKFKEKDTPDKLDRKELEGIRRYNTMSLRLKLVAYTSTNHYQVAFTIEKVE